jgi:PAS domain S-box-containing protein
MWLPSRAPVAFLTAERSHEPKARARIPDGGGLGAWPYTARLTAITTATGWIAACFGAITIAAAGELRESGTLWIFTWPFFLFLVVASISQLLAVGAGEAFGIPAIVRGIAPFNRAVALHAAAKAVPADTLVDALAGAGRFPLWNAAIAIANSSLVVAACIAAEWLASSGPANSGVIARAGLYAIALYATSTLVVAEGIMRPTCRELRRRAAALGLDPYGDFAMGAGYRIATSVIPVVVALLVALEIGVSPSGPSVAAYLALIVLGGLVALALGFLQQLNRMHAATELKDACRDLIAGTESVVVTGSTEAAVVSMARELNAAVSWVRAERRASNERYRALFEGAPDAILLADPSSGEIILANARAATLLGRSVEELHALPYAEVFSAATRDRHPLVIRPELEPGEVAAAFGEIVRADGSSCPVDVSLSRVPMGRRSLVQAILHDVSGRLQIQDELAAQNVALRAAQDRLMAHDRAKTEFLGTVSHELRTPLNIFVGYTEMLLEAAQADDLPATERAEILRRLLAGARTLASLVEDTLSVLRLDAASVRLDVEPVSLDALFAELEDADRLLRDAASVTERWIVEPALPRLVSDRRKLRQVLSNLIGNARKFTETGSIETRVARGPGRDTLRFTVTDTGCGIPEADLPFIFEPYRQAATRRIADGCGLGLYIVRRYVELLGGAVDCRSTVGVGTTFTFDLPCERDVPDRSEDATAATATAAAP